MATVLEMRTGAEKLNLSWCCDDVNTVIVVLPRCGYCTVAVVEIQATHAELFELSICSVRRFYVSQLWVNPDPRHTGNAKMCLRT